MIRINTCRFCKGWASSGLLKYGTRHYAHHRCYLDAGKSLADLRTGQIETFPYFLLKERELLPEAEAIIASRRSAP